jgi:ATP-dependent Clp protease ATP-binding subunit ClpA
MDDALARIDALDRRLAAIERWAGLRPDLADLDEEMAQVRREKETAIDAQDFETAAALRDKENRSITETPRSWSYRCLRQARSRASVNTRQVRGTCAPTA